MLPLMYKYNPSILTSPNRNSLIDSRLSIRIIWDIPHDIIQVSRSFSPACFVLESQNALDLISSSWIQLHDLPVLQTVLRPSFLYQCHVVLEVIVEVEGLLADWVEEGYNVGHCEVILLVLVG